jgi:predicted TIM-barrel fold metal-dependent hydrolase
VHTDTHAHAFPDLDFFTRALPDNVRAPVTSATSAMASVIGLLGRRGPLLDVEELARLRGRIPSLLHPVSEMTLSLAMLPQIALGARLDDLVASMDRHGIDRTVVIASTPTSPNDWLLAEAPAYEGRIVPVAHPPDLAAGATLTDWENAFDELADRGAMGFKIHHNMDGLDIDGPVYRAMFETARNHDIFIIIHTGRFNVVGYKHQRAVAPELFTGFFTDYPEVRVCLAHMNRDQPEAAWATMKRFDNLYSDTSWQPGAAVGKAVATVGAERILLGSDWPLLHADLQGECRSILERATSDDDYETIMTTAAARFIGA